MRSRGRELFHKRWEVSSVSRWHLGLNVGLLAPWLQLFTSPHCVSQTKTSVRTEMCLWKVGIWHDGIPTKFLIWHSWAYVLCVNVSLHSIQCDFPQCLSCFNLLIFFFPPLLGLLSHLVWPLFQVTSESPLDLKLRKVSVSPLHPLTSVQAVCRGQCESLFSFSYFGAHTTAFHSRGASVPENTHSLRFLIWGTVGLEGKK